MKHKPKLAVWTGLITICCAAFVAASAIAIAINERLPHSEDEAAYLFQAKVFALGRLTGPTPPAPDAFWSPFVLDYEGRRFGKYPPGWPLLLSLGVRLGLPWLVNALLGAMTLFLTGWLGVCFYPKKSRERHVALVAAGLGLVTPGFLLLSGSLLSHPASLFWNTLALLCLYQATCRRNFATTAQAVYSLLLGACLGAAFITRPFAAVSLALPIGIFLVIHVARRKQRWTSLLWLIAGGLPVAMLLPLFWWTLGDSPFFNPYLLVWPYDRVGFGPDVGPHGYTLSDALFINTRLKLQTLATGLFGWPGWSSLLFLPLPFLLGRANRWDWLLLGVIGSIVSVHMFYWAFGGADGGFPRYYYDALPAFLLLTARGILTSTGWLARWQPALRWLPAGLVAAFVSYNLVWTLPALLVEQRGKYGITAAPLAVVAQANLATPALILVEGVESWHDFAAPFAANSPLLDGPLVYAIDWGNSTSDELRRRFGERTCWELQGETLRLCTAR